jgi:rfaE bifunctional protein nucleotidyltransferase chain/domain
LGCFKNKFITRDILISFASKCRDQGLKIVFTNGCFDLLHRGHIEYLYKSSLLGDFLIVAINSDNSVRNLKGISRPIQDEISRALIISSLEFVSYVTLFDEDDPSLLIKEIFPSVLVKGSDYKIEQIAGYDFVLSYGGKVETVEITKGYSTSKIIEKIKV